MKPFLLAIDPGLSSGVILLDTTTLDILYSGEVDYKTLGDALHETLPKYAKEDLHIVAERFLITTATAKNSQAPYSLMVLGMLDWLIHHHKHGPVTLQTPADAKSLVDNDLIRSLGLWKTGGAGHYHDSVRHALLAMVRQGWKDRRLLGDDA